jgi:hypothetical protein
MPRTSRSVAQRLAAQTKSKKRRPPRTGTPSQDSPSAKPGPAVPTMAEILDEVVPSDAGPRAESRAALVSAPATTSTPNRLPATGGAAARRSATARPAMRPAPVRRRYREYAAEYQYVWTDLRRILIVAVILIVLLVVLSFVLSQ